MEDITMELAKANLDQDKNIVLLDVRQPDEYALGHIEGAINVPVMAIENEIEMIVPDYETTIYIYCRSGVRVLRAGDILEELGYTNVYNMGGILYWPYEIAK